MIDITPSFWERLFPFHIPWFIWPTDAIALVFVVAIILLVLHSLKELKDTENEDE